MTLEEGRKGFYKERNKGILVIDAEEGLAIFTIFLVLIDELIQGVEIRGRSTVHVIPPVANKVLLVENRSVGTQERVIIAIGLTHVKHLQKKTFQTFAC